MSGAWERQIGTAKRVPIAMIGTQNIDDYRLMTLLCEVESVMNGRPITPVSNDPNDFEALTPGHILRGGSNWGLPVQGEELSASYRRRWRHVQMMAERFWRRFVREYIPTLRSRHKYIRRLRNFKEGDMVLIATGDQPRGQWPLGRVLEVMPGADGLVRRVRIKTMTRELVRSTDKLCLLEGVVD